MDEVEDEPLFADRVAGIDIAKAEVMVTVRVPSDARPGRRRQETRPFRTILGDLLVLAGWLRTWGVTKVGMEATGDYWKPVLFLLEREGFECLLYHAAHVKALPGRPKTDKLDSVWLAKITERGSLPASFIPPEPIRRLRTCTRYRRHLTQARTAEKQRTEKLLEDAHFSETVQRDLRHPRRLRPGHAGGDRRRAARPEGAGPAGPRQHARQDPAPGRSAGLLVLHR